MENLQSDSGNSQYEVSKARQARAPRPPTWLLPLLAHRFFEQCERHANENRSEENHFCMDCACRLCPNCVVEHTNNGQTHNLLQIRHYVHSDVVRVNDVYKLLDVAQIQPYIANGAKVVHLNPKSSRPYPEGVPKSYIGGTPCIVCYRAIAKPNLFCCIACKISKLSCKKGILTIEESTGDKSCITGITVKRCFTEKEESCASVSAASEPASEKSDATLLPGITSFRKKSRKGIPVRAPFF